MKQVYDTLAAIKADIVSTQLHPSTRSQLDASMRRIEQLGPILDSWRQLAILYERMVNEAQKYRFIGFKTQQARFLGREADCYPKCANG